MSCGSDSSSEANSGCCHISDVLSNLKYIVVSSAQIAVNFSVRLDLILLMRDKYINSNLNPLTNFMSSSKSTEFKGIVPWNIS